MAERIRVVVVGACGSMGRETVKAVCQAGDLELVGAVNRSHAGQDIGQVAGPGPLGILVSPDLEGTLEAAKPQVMVDFTEPEGIMSRIQTAILHGVRPVVGTTGISQAEVEDLRALCRKYRLGAVVAPNFAIGALLMMRFAAEAARFFMDAEIIEMHHPRKLDSPSGTAIKTAEMIQASRARSGSGQSVLHRSGAVEKLQGARGGEMGGIHIHSVRLPGLVAHQEVLFGNPSETLTIRHDSLSRESFMPGVLLAIRKVMELSDLVYGLESLVFGAHS
ncbi:MAG: 4-hydroxy-tetrahydrodipicolinate reductase [Firmicutes bacterium]|nr:4-hydroxy-tetrahydrodipicolinate reductase [Bacillota bacterium]